LAASAGGPSIGDSSVPSFDIESTPPDSPRLMKGMFMLPDNSRSSREAKRRNNPETAPFRMVVWFRW
jgi:hypothetical protein